MNELIKRIDTGGIMAHIRMKIYSNCLRRYTHVTVLIPTPTENDYLQDIDTYDKPAFFQERPRYRVLYLLHGTHGDDTDWSYYSNVERDIIGTDLMVVCPDGGNSFWVDMEDGPRQQTFLTGELREYINRMFPTRPERENTFIAGLSMGAYASLNTAFRYSHLYSKVAGLSGGVGTGSLSVLRTRTYPYKLILDPPDYAVKGSALDGEESIRILLSSGNPVPDVYLTVGSEDELVYTSVQESRRLLDDYRIPYVYDEGSGGHTFEFWSEHIARIIPWMLEK